jgi:hypothetical protein
VRAAELLRTKLDSKEEPLTAAIKHGIEHEDDARRAYVANYPEQRYLSMGLAVHPQEPWLGASPDLLVVDPITERIQGLVELKAPYSRGLPQQVEDHHLVQVLTQLAVITEYITFTSPLFQPAEPLWADIFYWTKQGTRTFRVQLEGEHRAAWEHDYLPR